MANDLSLNEFVEEICFAFFSFSACFYLVSSQSYSDVKKMLIYPAVFHQLGYLDVCVCVIYSFCVYVWICLVKGDRALCASNTPHRSIDRSIENDNKPAYGALGRR